MLDLEKLEEEREESLEEKAELFEFYHQNWSKVITELRAARDRLHAIELHHDLKAGRA